MPPSLAEPGIDRMELHLVEDAQEDIEKPANDALSSQENHLVDSRADGSASGGDQAKDIWASLSTEGQPSKSPNIKANSVEAASVRLVQFEKRSKEDPSGQLEGPAKGDGSDPLLEGPATAPSGTSENTVDTKPISNVGKSAEAPAAVQESENATYLKQAQEKAKSDRAVLSTELAMLRDYTDKANLWQQRKEANSPGYDAKSHADWQQKVEETRGRVAAHEKTLQETQQMIDYFSGVDSAQQPSRIEALDQTPQVATPAAVFESRVPVVPIVPKVEPTFFKPETGLDSFATQLPKYQSERYDLRPPTEAVRPRFETTQVVERPEAEVNLSRQEIKYPLANGKEIIFGPDVPVERMAELMKAMGGESAPQSAAALHLEDQPRRSETAPRPVAQPETRRATEQPRVELPKFNLAENFGGRTQRSWREKTQDFLARLPILRKFINPVTAEGFQQQLVQTEKKFAVYDKAERAAMKAADTLINDLLKQAEPLLTRFENIRADLAVALQDKQSIEQAMAALENVSNVNKKRVDAIKRIRNGVLKNNTQVIANSEAKMGQFGKTLGIILEQANRLASRDARAGELVRQIEQITNGQVISQPVAPQAPAASLTNPVTGANPEAVAPAAA